jgi:hypothetical protein
MRTKSLSIVCTTAIVVVGFASQLAAPAAAATGQVSVHVKGRGVVKAGREVSASIGVTNVNRNAANAPERLNQLLIISRALRYNSRARSYRRCSAALPNTGSPARCSRRTKVGSGSFTGIFGQPLQPASMLGTLAPVSGTITLYNYKPGGGQQVRLLAVMRTRTPLAGVSINLLVPVSRRGTMTINIPDVSQMPPAIPAALPPGSRFVLTNLKATVKAPRERRGKPFVYLSTTKKLDVNVEASYE